MFTRSGAKTDPPIGIGGVEQGTTADGFESHFGTNHLSHFLLFTLLRHTLAASSTASFASRVVVLSSLVHRIAPLNQPDYHFTSTPYSEVVAYASSKNANIHFANEVERRYSSPADQGDDAIHAVSLHPGGIATGLARYHSPAYLALMEQYLQSTPGLDKTFKSVEQGAATTVLAAVGRALEGVGGVYLDDCGVQEVMEGEGTPTTAGSRKWAYDEAVQRKLWEDSEKMVGVEKGE